MVNTQVSALARLVALRLWSRAGNKGHSWPQQETLAAELGYSTRSVRRAIRECVNAKLFREVPRACGKGSVHVFGWSPFDAKTDDELATHFAGKPRSCKPRTNPAACTQAIAAADVLSDEPLLSGETDTPPCMGNSLQSESQSSSLPSFVSDQAGTTTEYDATATNTPEQPQSDEHDTLSTLAQAVHSWAETWHVSLRNADRTIGPPALTTATEWARIAATAGIQSQDEMFLILTHAKSEADRITAKRREHVRYWSFLTLQIADSCVDLAPRILAFRPQEPVTYQQTDNRTHADPRDPERVRLYEAFVAWSKSLSPSVRKSYGIPLSDKAWLAFKASGPQQI